MFTAATETAIATPAPHTGLTVPDTALIDPATSHAPESSVAAPSDNFFLCMIFPYLTLSRTKNTDDVSNNKTIKRRVSAWHSCNISELFREAIAIQKRINSRIKKQHSDLKMFNDFMSRGKISIAICVLLDEHKVSVLAPTYLKDGRPVLEILRDKLPEGQPFETNCIQSEHPRTLHYHPTVFDKN